MYGAYVGSGGVELTTISGAVSLIEAVMDASAGHSHAMASLLSRYGQLSIHNVSLTDTILRMESEVGQIVLSNVLR